MTGDLDSYSDSSKHSNKLSALRHRLFPRTRGSRTEDDVVEEHEVSVRTGVQRRARAAVRKSFMAVATAVIVRASFSPQAASAVGYKPRSGGAPSSRQVLQCWQYLVFFLLTLSVMTWFHVFRATAGMYYSIACCVQH